MDVIGVDFLSRRIVDRSQTGFCRGSFERRIRHECPQGAAGDLRGEDIACDGPDRAAERVDF